MRQRLNIEIKKGRMILVNSYFHWPASSLEALKLTKTIVENIDKIKEENDLLYAVRLLETTGARLTKNEIAFARSVIGWQDEPFKPAVDQNEGLIALSAKGKLRNRKFEEGRVTIRLDTKVVDFGVVTVFTPEEYEQFCMEVARCTPVSSIPFATINFSLSCVPFFRLNVLEDFMIVQDTEPFRDILDPDHVYMFIH